MILSIPISVGELFDKYSILLIKKDKINDILKLENINKEIKYLEPFIAKFNMELIFLNELIEINKQLWEIEDNIRLKENKKEFDNEFIELARSVYITNDKRFILKNKINTFANSDIKEMKSYV